MHRTLAVAPESHSSSWEQKRDRLAAALRKTL
ncbi:hypothetical protein TTRE_0000113301 [Trichuris trichiura]|uniref:Uncharacterized protein n=1 Tax=Trichuris trichiura TaxID=36087 RepID=A0A077YYI3_TRITR|nr:hypothetical protein TTRE_0000113301 [Trichuris trichiura]